MRTIRFYVSESGHTPVEEFLNSLDGKQAQKVAWVLQLIEDLEVVPAQYFKKLVSTDDIWEVRVQFGGNIFRLLGFLDGASLVILTNGFAKKTQKHHLQRSSWPNNARRITSSETEDNHE